MSAGFRAPPGPGLPIPPGARTLVLFDIDGTLVSTDGAGRAAMNQAAGLAFGRPDLFDGLSFAGAIDDEIVGRALATAGLPPTARRRGRLRAAYLRALRRTLRPDRGRVHPGVEATLRALARGAALGLLTGNWQRGAELKLTRFGLWSLFRPSLGAWGDDARERDGLVPVAWARARRMGLRPDRVVVVGDTEADVRCARAGQAALGPGGPEVLAVAVATGFAPRARLVQAAPDLLLEDLETGRAALLALCGIGA